jgi:hypothetical protein
MKGKKPQATFVLCVRNDGAEDLEARKVYQVVRDRSAAREGHVRVIDESGEDYLYPAEYFAPVKLSLGVALELASSPSQSFPRTTQKARRR